MPKRMKSSDIMSGLRGRALNTHGKWKIIVNDIPASYDKLTQTVRVEKCKYDEAPCPKIPGTKKVSLLGVWNLGYPEAARLIKSTSVV